MSYTPTRILEAVDHVHYSANKDDARDHEAVDQFGDFFSNHADEIDDRFSIPADVGEIDLDAVRNTAPDTALGRAVAATLESACRRYDMLLGKNTRTPDDMRPLEYGEFAVVDQSLNVVASFWIEHGAEIAEDTAQIEIPGFD